MIQHRQPSPVKPARVVILGARGFIARDLARHLAESGVEVQCIGAAELDLLAPGSADQLRQRLHPEDALVVTSALTPEKGKDVPTFMKNLTMVANVCAALEASPCAHIVYLSSDAVFEDQVALLSEQTPRVGTGLYGLMHAAREQMLLHSATLAKVPLCIVRPCAVYGAGDTHNSYGPNRFLRTAFDQGKITLFGEGEEQRDHISVRDLSRLIEGCLERRSDGAINAATGAAVSFREIAQEIMRQCPSPVELVCLPRGAGSVITHRHFDVSLRLHAFPAFHCTPLPEGLMQMRRQV